MNAGVRRAVESLSDRWKLGMKNIDDSRKALVKTSDGQSVLLWVAIFAGLLIWSVIATGDLALSLLKYLFFSLIVILIFVRFRMSGPEHEWKTNYWALVNVYAFGLFVIFMEMTK